MSAPLEGVTVLDLTTRLPGPLATLVFAQAGARVVRVERAPHGEELRGFEPRLDGLSAHYQWLNRDKETVLLDLKSAAGREALEALIAEADVLVEQFRPGVMERLGFGRESVLARYPGLVWCAITGYGQHDPRSSRAAHDLNYQADAGLVSLLPDSTRGVPALPPVLLSDVAGGSWPAVTNVLLALLRRERTGRGGFVDIPMSRNVEIFALWARIEGSLTGRWPSPGRSRHSGGSPRYNLYATRDGRLLAVAALEERFWREFLDAVGLEIPPGLESGDPDAAIKAVADHLAARDADHWMARVAGRDTCCNLVRALHELEDDGMLSRAAGGDRRLPCIPLPIDPMLTRK